MSIQLQDRAQLALRPIVEEDMGFLRRLYRTTRYDVAQLPWSDVQKTLFLEHQFQAQHRHYQKFFSEAEFNIVLTGETPIGRLYVYYGSDEFRIIDISILPEYRNRGTGTNLMSEIIARAAVERVPVRLRVEKNNPVLQWYRKSGFRVMADEQLNWHMELEPQKTEL